MVFFKIWNLPEDGTVNSMEQKTRVFFCQIEVQEFHLSSNFYTFFVTWEVKVTLLPAAWVWGEFDSTLDVQELHLCSLLHLLLPKRWGWHSSLLREGEVNLTRVLSPRIPSQLTFTRFATWEVRVTLLPAAWGWGEFDRQALASPPPPAPSGRLLLAPSQLNIQFHSL